MFKKSISLFLAFALIGSGLLLLIPKTSAIEVTVLPTKEEQQAIIDQANKDLEAAIEERKNLQDQLDSLNSQLDGIEDNIVWLETQSASYTERKTIVEEQITLLVDSIDLQGQTLAIKQEELDQKQREYEESYELFKERLRAMYMTNNATDLSIVLGADSFSKMLTASTTVNAISEHDQNLINKILTEKEIIEKAKVEIEQNLALLEADQAELESKKDELATLLAEANAQLTAENADLQATEAAYAAAIAQREAADSEIDRLMEVVSTIPYVGGYFTWPVPGYPTITSGFGPRTLYGAYNYHKGIDIAGSSVYGKPVVSSNDGKVITTIYGWYGYGHYVIVDHGDPYKTLYGHLSSISVSNGEWVAQGQQVGLVGSTGNSTGPHLHFEIRESDTAINPVDLLKNR